MRFLKTYILTKGEYNTKSSNTNLNTLDFYWNNTKIEIPIMYKSLDEILNFKNFPKVEQELNEFGREELGLIIENFHNKFCEMLKDPIV